MAYRVLRYATLIWDAHLRENPRARRLPPVIPLVVHHNSRRPWSSPVQLPGILGPGIRGQAQKYLPRFEFLLDDLSRIDEQALRCRPLTPPALMTLLLLKTAPGNPRLFSDLLRWADHLRAVLAEPDGFEQFTALVSYIIEIAGEGPAGELHDLLASLGPQAEEAFVTIADTLRADGEARGRAGLLLEQLAHKFGPLPEDLPGTVHAASSDQIQAWATRILTADTLDQVFG